MRKHLRITSANDVDGRDAAVVALSKVATQSGQVNLTGISLTAAGPVIHTRSHAGVESDSYFGTRLVSTT